MHMIFDAHCDTSDVLYENNAVWRAIFAHLRSACRLCSRFSVRLRDFSARFAKTVRKPRWVFDFSPPPLTTRLRRDILSALLSLS